MSSNRLLRQACAAALGLAAATSFNTVLAADPPRLTQPASFNVKPQPLASALSEFALRTHQQILFTPDVVRGKATAGVSGRLTADAALVRLLAGTNLSWSRSADGVILIRHADGSDAPAPQDPTPPAGTATDVPSGNNPGSTTLGETTLEEVVVTATGRRQNIQDVPYNISAISGDTLQAKGITDYYQLAKAVPGLAVSDVGARGGLASSLIIRGISILPGVVPQFPETTQPAVSTYIDSTPIFANLRITDLDRVEVLRGPQGTLYGANSSGGTIRFIYNQPRFDATTLQVSGGVAHTGKSSGVDYNADLTGNLPLSPTWALRVNLGYERDAGFIDANHRYVVGADGVPVPVNSADLINSPAQSIRVSDVNWERTASARVALRWQPNDMFNGKLTYQYQTEDSGGLPSVSYQAYGLQSFETSSHISEPFNSSVNFASLETETEFGFATFTTSSSYYKTHARGINDFTGFYFSFPFYPTVYGNSPRFLAKGYDTNDNDGFVQELRMASKGDGPFKWIAGAFYQHRNTFTDNRQFVPGYSDFFDACISDPNNTRPCGFGTFYPQVPSYADGRVQNVKDFAYLDSAKVRFSDMALYSEVEWSISSRWRLTAGLRGYRQKTTNDQVGGLLFLGPDSVGGATRSQSTTGLLSKAGMSYTLSPATMIYTLFSQGIRPAGINGLPENTYDFTGSPTPTPTALFQYRSDKIDNYEVGVKGTLLQRLNYTLTGFNMNWNSVQLGTSVTALEIGAVINAGNARTRGIEFEIGGRVTDRLSANIGYTYVNAHLTSSNPPEGVDPASYDPGARLPGVPDQLVSVGLDYQQPLASDASISYSLSGAYRGRSSSALLISQDTPAGGFLTMDASVSYNQGPWIATLYARNLANKVGVYGYSAANWGDWAGATITRPRAIGLKATYNWGKP